MDFKLRILGSSSALPTSERFPTAQVVLYNNEPYLIDCAEGTQMQMRKYGVPFGKLKNIFISHLHGDHIYGLFGLLSSFNLLGRKQNLNIYAPAKLKDIYEAVLNHNNDQLKYKINFVALNDNGKNKIFENKHIQVFSFPLKHSKPVWGFLFEEKQKQLNIKKEAIEEFNLSIKQILTIKNGKDLIIDNMVIENQKLTIPAPKPLSFAFCTDTLPIQNLNEYINGVDTLYHEATFGSELIEIAKETMHSTAAQAAMIAKQVNAKQLVIGHFSSRYKSMEKLIEEAKEVFPDTIEAIDGLLIDISKTNC
ncbi:MAG: ribonuclease Z [Bacteroidales bacterium]|nr:ribonuclease Z [Bacteroidales bacterium]MDD4216842.1 ribonuclease Z [Bacteroidales bacterium]MDY0142263.1 ribonuclease Z [Bacteroidales bacterium]